MSARVVILQETLPQYRIDLFTEICTQAARQDIDMRVVHGRAPGKRGERLGGSALPGSTVIENRYIRLPFLQGAAVWQPALRTCLAADLVVVEQANRMLINYLLLLAQRLGGPPVAFWGHGRNWQSSPATILEQFKARMVRMPAWWFAYTGRVAESLAAQGVPDRRITTVGNTIDVVALKRAVCELRGRQDLEAPRSRCVYLGGLYPFKRLDFLFDAADLIAEAVPDFELQIAGTGEQSADVERFAASRPWVQYRGAAHGDDRARLLASARLLLVPGLVGLVLLDSFAAGVPLLTTADALHSPEVDYLVDGENGAMVPPGASAVDYAEAVIGLLQDESRWQILSAGASRSANDHTLDSAAAHFVHGASAALSAPHALTT